MTRAVILLLVASVGLSACASRFNPLNWFGRDREQVVEVAPEAATLDGRQLVTQITELAVDQTPGGAIIRVVGLPPTQGFWDAALVRVPTENPADVLYDFRVVPPVFNRAAGTQQSREIIAGAALSNAQLRGVRSITVRALQNQRSVRR